MKQVKVVLPALTSDFFKNFEFAVGPMSQELYDKRKKEFDKLIQEIVENRLNLSNHSNIFGIPFITRDKPINPNQNDSTISINQDNESSEHPSDVSYYSDDNSESTSYESENDGEQSDENDFIEGDDLVEPSNRAAQFSHDPNNRTTIEILNQVSRNVDNSSINQDIVRIFNNQSFDTISNAYKSIMSFSLNRAYPLRRKSDRTTLHCHCTECKLKIKISQQDDHYITKVIGEHTCHGSKYIPTNLIDAAIAESMALRCRYNSKQFTDMVNNKLPRDVSARRILDRCKAKFGLSFTKKLHSWTMITHLLKTIHNECGAITKIKLKNDEKIYSSIDEIESSFGDNKIEIESFCFMTNDCKEFVKSKAFSGMISMDGSFYKDVKPGQIIAISTETPKQKILPLVVGFAPSESIESCNMFCDALIEALPTLDTVKSVFTDEGAAIMGAARNKFTKSKIRQCLYHIMEKPSSNLIRNEISNIMKVKTITEFNSIIEIMKKKVRESNCNQSTLYNTIRTIEENNFLKEPVLDNMRITTQISESLNALFKAWNMPNIFELMKKFIEKVRATIWDLLDSPTGDKFQISFDEFARSNLADSYKISGTKVSRYFVIKSKTSQIKYIVTQNDDIIKCECARFARTGFPCWHILALLMHDMVDKKDVLKQMHPCHNSDNYVSDLMNCKNVFFSENSMQFSSLRLIITGIKSLKKQKSKRYKSRREMRKASLRIPSTN